MKIQAMVVERDEHGFWTHPHLPYWDEQTTQETVDAWKAEQEISFAFDRFEFSATDEEVDQWFTEEKSDCSGWEPKCDKEGAFLLSIHDTEDGPVAAFGYRAL